ncbi:MAG: ribonuclease R [Nitrospirae bacterium]|nr:ribonuclease R [Nitrospirota bacterium]
MFAQEEILQKIREKSDHPMLMPELIRALSIPKEERVVFKKLLRKMTREGEIVRTKGNRYGLPEKMSLVSGQLKGHPDGYGFVIPDKPGTGDIYIGSKNMEGAMHGDKVVARIEARKEGGNLEGRIIRVLERTHTRIVGRFESGRGFGFVVPSDKRINQDLYILHGEMKRAREGDMVVAEITSYPTKNRNPQGKIIRILGRSTDARIETEAVIEEYNLQREFPPDVLEESEHIPEEVMPEMLAGRADLRDLQTVTIDGERARDFDDAVSIEQMPDRGFRLFVHIADVSHYVAEGSALDLDAFGRGTSVYFPDAVIPMFPERLSNGICSLNPKVDRLTMTAEMYFDSEGNRTSYKIYDSVIQSNERMTYTAVRQILVDRDQEITKRYKPMIRMFELMEALSRRLYAKRIRRGSLDFDLPEPEIVLDMQGEPVNIIKEERNIAHRIIEEFMLAANETVAEHICRLEIPFLYRIHEEPNPEKMIAFSEFIHNFGIRLPVSGGIRPLTLSEILDRVKDTPEERLINHVLLRSMKRARYSEENLGHFGLAAEFYTHFTSPIRRYPDLIVHRILREVGRKKALARKRAERWKEILPNIALQTSERERLAMEAERESVNRQKVRFMADKEGEEHDGFITGVTAYGFFVELEALFVEGLVRVSTISDDYYVYHEKQHAFIGEHSQRIFRLGDKVRVRVKRVDIESRTIDFTLVEESNRKKRKN